MAWAWIPIQYNYLLSGKKIIMTHTSHASTVIVQASTVIVQASTVYVQASTVIQTESNRSYVFLQKKF